MEPAPGRPSWPSIFFNIALKLSERSTCPRRSTGAVLVTQGDQILATGYNGAPRGLRHCTDVGCLMVDGHCLRTVHAEMNVLLQCARLGVASNNTILYATDRPCIRCIPALIQAGIRSIVYLRPYDTDGKLDDVQFMCSVANVGIGKVTLG